MDIQIFIDQMKAVAKQLFDLKTSSGEKPADAVGTCFDAVGEAIEALFGSLPEEFAELKAAAMLTFTNDGFTAALDNLISQLMDSVDVDYVLLQDGGLIDLYAVFGVPAGNGSGVPGSTGLGYTPEGDGSNDPDPYYQVFGKGPYLGTRGPLTETGNNLNPTSTSDNSMPDDFGWYGADGGANGGTGGAGGAGGGANGGTGGTGGGTGGGAGGLELAITMYGYTQTSYSGNFMPTQGGHWQTNSISNSVFVPSHSAIQYYNSSSPGGKGAIELYGQEGYDRLSVRLYATGDNGGIGANDVLISGIDENETLNLLASAGSAIGSNQFVMLGEAGNDVLNLDVNVHNDFYNNGPASAWMAGNWFIMQGGAGDDTLNFNANIDNIIPTPAGGPITGDAHMTSNFIIMAGGTGDDTLNFNANIHNDIFHNGPRSAGMNGNFIIMLGSEGNDTLNFSASVYNASATAGSRHAQIAGNMIMMRGDLGDDTLNFSANVHNDNVAGPLGNGATIAFNQIVMDGGTGNDALSINLNASGTFINVNSNQVAMVGGDGNDTLSFNISANAGLGGNVANNTITMDGGAGNDVLNFNLNGSGISVINNNEVNIHGGAGNDTISIAAPTGFGLEYIFQYSNTSELGDAINGLASGHIYQLEFENSNFNGVETAGHLAAINFVDFATGSVNDANDFWHYYQSGTNYVLAYDDDGNGTHAAQVVATFDTDVGMDATHIDLV
ncbi:MAG: calcium-binding protein [Desulfobacteraceae bacterium]|nr:calcium-binding protein [Desulfobacteraceae bacterium]